MASLHILTITKPGPHRALRGRRLRVIAGLTWADLPPGAPGRAQLPSKTGQYLTLTTTSGAFTRRTAFTSEPGHLWSLAVLAVDTLKGNGYAFVRNGTEISFVACVHGIPALVGDITGSRETVEQASETFLQLHKQDTPPGGWAIVGSPDNPADVSEVIPEKFPRNARLRPINFQARLVALLVLSSLLVSVALWQWNHSQRQKADLQRAARQIQALQKPQLSGPARRPEPPPWPALPSVKDFMNSCMPMLRMLEASVEGWDLTAAECRVEGVKVEYTRPVASNATFAAFRTAAKKLSWVQRIVLDDSTGGKAQLQHDWNLPPGGDTLRLSEEEHLSQFLLYFQATSRTISMQKQPDLKNRIVVINGEEVEQFRDWYEWQFSLSERRAPDPFATWSLPATRITAISFTLSDDDELTWKTEGRTWSFNTQTEAKHDLP